MGDRLTVRCFTNLDDYKRKQWPTSLPAVPTVGQKVASESGAVLRIVGLTWQFDGTLQIELHKGGLQIELHKGGSS